MKTACQREFSGTGPQLLYLHVKTMAFVYNNFGELTLIFLALKSLIHHSVEIFWKLLA